MIDKNKIKIRKLTVGDAEQYVKLHNIALHIEPKQFVQI